MNSSPSGVSFSAALVKEIIFIEILSLRLEIPSSTEWYFPASFSPNIFVEINKELKSKIRALLAYKNEIRNFPHPRSSEAIEIIAKRWGTVCGLKAAEAFYLVRKIDY